MILRSLQRKIKGQQGFTLLEVIATLLITSLIGLGATMATVQVLSQGSRNSDYTTASRQSMNAVYWISRDTQMAQVIEPEGTSGFPLTLSWHGWDNSEYQVIYSLEDDRLMRSYSLDGGDPMETLVAQYISSESENTNCATSNGTLTLKVTAIAGEGAHAISVTKTRDIAARPGL